jgi:hypothetical protein
MVKEGLTDAGVSSGPTRLPSYVNLNVPRAEEFVHKVLPPTNMTRLLPFRTFSVQLFSGYPTGNNFLTHLRGLEDLSEPHVCFDFHRDI